MITGVIVFVSGVATGFFIARLKEQKATTESADKYEKYRNTDGLLSAKVMRESKKVGV